MFFIVNCQNKNVNHHLVDTDNDSQEEEERKFLSVDDTDLLAKIMEKVNNYGRSEKYMEGAVLLRYIIDLPTIFDHRDEGLEKLHNTYISKSKGVEIDKAKLLRATSLELKLDLESYMLHKKAKETNKTMKN